MNLNFINNYIKIIIINVTKFTVFDIVGILPKIKEWNQWKRVMVNLIK